MISFAAPSHFNFLISIKVDEKWKYGEIIYFRFLQLKQDNKSIRVNMERELYIELTFEINFGYFLTSDQCCNDRIYSLAVLSPLTLVETSVTDSM